MPFSDLGLLPASLVSPGSLGQAVEGGEQPRFTPVKFPRDALGACRSVRASSRSRPRRSLPAAWCAAKRRPLCPGVTERSHSETGAGSSAGEPGALPVPGFGPGMPGVCRRSRCFSRQGPEHRPASPVICVGTGLLVRRQRGVEAMLSPTSLRLHRDLRVPRWVRGRLRVNVGCWGLRPPCRSTSVRRERPGRWRLTPTLPQPFSAPALAGWRCSRLLHALLTPSTAGSWTHLKQKKKKKKESQEILFFFCLHFLPSPAETPVPGVVFPRL